MILCQSVKFFVVPHVGPLTPEVPITLCPLSGGRSFSEYRHVPISTFLTFQGPKKIHNLQLQPHFQYSIMSTIIVGAGAAGITAAYTLLQEGFNDFIILEASSTYLGRIKKLDNFTNFPIDIGAEWIHVDPSILTTIVNDADVTVDIKTIPYTPSYFEWDGALLNEASLPRVDDHKFFNYSWYDFFDDYLVPNVLPKVTFDCSVSKISWSNLSANVTCDDGQAFAGKKVIVTVPISVLQDEDIEFVPELPSEFIDAVNEPVMAAGMKVFLRFKEKFYPDTFIIESDFDNIVLDQSERFFYDETYGQNSTDNVMGMFVFGDVADRFIALSDENVIQAALTDINTVFGNNISSSTFIEGYVQNWVNEPFIRGAYSVYEDNCEAIDILREPVSGVLFFAGEAIPIQESDYANGFVHGAALSGRNAAKLTLSDDQSTTGTTPTKSPTKQTTSASNPIQRLFWSGMIVAAAFSFSH